MKLPGRREKQSPTVMQRLDGRRREAVLLASAATALVLSAGAWRKLRASNRPAAEPSPPAASQPVDAGAGEAGDAAVPGSADSGPTDPAGTD